MYFSVARFGTFIDRFSRPMVLVALSVFLTSCTQLQSPKVEPFYAPSVPPIRQELRWSNGKTPQSMDPAKAASAPETDIVRAVYEGLTDLDSRSLSETPGVAERWESSADLKTWTFYLRKDAKWSNGQPVTADDFVASWKRLAGLREKAANNYLFQNIVGMGLKRTDPETGEPLDFLPPAEPATGNNESIASGLLSQTQLPNAGTPATPSPTPSPSKIPTSPNFGVEAVNESTLRISLNLPDKDFPKLVAHTVFRPVYKGGVDLENVKVSGEIVTNGAFRVAKGSVDDIVLERAETYWNRRAIALERVRFVPASSAENALAAYKRGDVDVITNASFEPLALKLLAPYEDFRRATHNALNFYEFNAEKAPFNDRRVREALALAIDRAKLTDGDLEGTYQPAYSLFPVGQPRREALIFDTLKAKQQLEKAGFADGKGFPTIRLIINRNDVQHRIARSVARMWKQNLGIETEIIQREAKELETVRDQKDFDLLRRGVVLPTNDELVNIESILGSARKPPRFTPPELKVDENPITFESETDPDGTSAGPTAASPEVPTPSPTPETELMTVGDAVFDVKVIPLYFPTSYSLVKPYIRGFEVNGLDAPSLKEVSIDSNWQLRASR